MNATVQTQPASIDAASARWIPALHMAAFVRARLASARISSPGITLAAYLLPAGIGDASLANLPPEAGLYACLFSGLVFWLFCSSRHTAITVTSAISLLVGSSLGGIAGWRRHPASARWRRARPCSWRLIAFIAWLVKAGLDRQLHLRDRAGRLQVRRRAVPREHAVAQAVRHPRLARRFLGAQRSLPQHLGETNPASLALGAGRAGGARAGQDLSQEQARGAVRRRRRHRAASGLLDLDARGVKLLGEVPQGLPAHRPAGGDWADLNELLPLAMACFLLGAVETAAIGRMFAAKHGERLDANQEFLALAGANLAAGLGRGFPVSGGMSQSLVNESGGARTPLSGAFAAGYPARGDAIPRASVACICRSRCWRRSCSWPSPGCSSSRR